jgi:hypothetical protein
MAGQSALHTTLLHLRMDFLMNLRNDRVARN